MHMSSAVNLSLTVCHCLLGGLRTASGWITCGIGPEYNIKKCSEDKYLDSAFLVVETQCAYRYLNKDGFLCTCLYLPCSKMTVFFIDKVLVCIFVNFLLNYELA